MPSTVDVDLLLVPLPGDDPAGDPRAYAHGIREELSELRRAEDPDDFTDATRPSVLKRADWQGLIDRATRALTSEAKDLRIACQLLEGLVRVEGMAGLSAGLELIRRLIEEAWERILPAIDDEDGLGNRAAILANLLDDAERGVRFPHTVRCVPLFEAEERSYTTLDLLHGDETGLAAPARLLDAQRREALTATALEADKAAGEIRRLAQLLEERCGPDAPGFLNLSAAVDDTLKVIRQRLLVAPYGPVGAAARSAAASAQESADGAIDPTGATSPAPPVAGTRADVYALLDWAADRLETIEPHSPVPYLVRRAVDLGRLPFPRLLAEMVREERLLGELNREYGIRQASQAVQSGT